MYLYRSPKQAEKIFKKPNSMKKLLCLYNKVYSKIVADPDNIDERANAVRRKFSKFADNFDQGWHGLNQVVLTMV